MFMTNISRFWPSLSLSLSTPGQRESNNFSLLFFLLGFIFRFSFLFSLECLTLQMLFKRCLTFSKSFDRGVLIFFEELEIFFLSSSPYSPTQTLLLTHTHIYSHALVFFNLFLIFLTSVDARRKQAFVVRARSKKKRFSSSFFSLSFSRFELSISLFFLCGQSSLKAFFGWCSLKLSITWGRPWHF